MPLAVSLQQTVAAAVLIFQQFVRDATSKIFS